MSDAFVIDSIRTPIGRFGGALAPVRPDDLAAHAIEALRSRNPAIDWDLIDDVILGCANQAGEDNRNVARMSLLLAGLSDSIPGVTVNRLCGSGMESIGSAWEWPPIARDQRRQRAAPSTRQHAAPPFSDDRMATQTHHGGRRREVAQRLT